MIVQISTTVIAELTKLKPTITKIKHFGEMLFLNQLFRLIPDGSFNIVDIVTPYLQLRFRRVECNTLIFHLLRSLTATTVSIQCAVDLWPFLDISEWR